MLCVVAVSPLLGRPRRQELPAEQCCHLYVVLTAKVAANIEGLVKRLELPADLEDHGELLPSSLSEALSALESDGLLCEALAKV